MTRLVPTILFGAFDRHNFGDLLFPHIAARLLKEDNPIFAGLAERDLRCYGGHAVHALAQLATQLRNCEVNIIHAGGELLACDAWQAAVMLLPPEEAQTTIARLEAYPRERLEWAHEMLGVDALAPYLVHRSLFPRTARIIYNAVGGVDLDDREPAMRYEVLAKLRAANEVAVRDRQTQSLLMAAGIQTRLMPDPAVMVAELFGTEIRACSMENALVQLRQAFPRGYMAIQFSADFGDDETLAAIAAQLDLASRSTGHGVVFFRAGAAPWHDDLLCYRRVAARMRTSSVRFFTSLKLWDICALIACSRAYCGSSLHGRIVAMAFALPRVNLLHPAQTGKPAKQLAFASTWEAPGMPVITDVDKLALNIQAALATDGEQRQRTAAELTARFRLGFDAICAGIHRAHI